MAIKGIVLPPITTFEPEGARLIGVPDTVMAGEPAPRVWPSIMYWNALLAAIVLPPTIRFGRDNGEGASS